MGDGAGLGKLAPGGNSVTARTQAQFSPSAKWEA